MKKPLYWFTANTVIKLHIFRLNGSIRQSNDTNRALMALAFDQQTKQTQSHHTQLYRASSMRNISIVLPVIVPIAKCSHWDVESLPDWIEGVLYHLCLMADGEPWHKKQIGGGVRLLRNEPELAAARIKRSFLNKPYGTHPLHQFTVSYLGRMLRNATKRLPTANRGFWGGGSVFGCWSCLR